MPRILRQRGEGGNETSKGDRPLYRLARVKSGEDWSLTFDTLARTNLVFPLSGHHLGIDAGNLDPSIQTGFVVRLDDISAIDLTSANTTVVWSLSSRETALGPTIWPAIGAEESIFLLQPKPEMMLLVGIHQPRGLVSVVELVGASIRVPSLAHDKNVGFKANRIGENGNWSNVDIGVVSGGLSGGRTIKVPFRKLIDAFDGFFEGLEGRS